MFKRKLIGNAMMFAILFSFALQLAMFGTSVSSKKTFSGIVYASPGVPVSGAMVIAFGPNGYGTASTGTNGQYTITEGLKAGTYAVRVMKEGYIDGEKENVVVTVGSETPSMDLYLNRSGGVSGTITDASTHNPIPNIAVIVLPSTGAGANVGTGLSNAAGNYQVNTNLATGSYNVSVFFPEGYAGKTAGPVTVTAGSMTTGINLALERSGIISGKVTATPNGEPLANATVTAFATSGLFGTDQTNATGYYRIASGLGNGTYTVMATYKTSYALPIMDVVVTAGAETPNINFGISVSPPPPSGIIMGKVTDTSSKPIAGAHVVAEGDTTASSGSAYTGEDGTYVISEDLQTDTYTVTASAPGYQDQQTTSVNVVEDQITPNVNFQLQTIPQSQSGRISGTVTGDENPIPEFQYPIAVMLVITLVAVAIAKSPRHKTHRSQTNQRVPHS